MGFVIGILTAVMVVDCLALILLVLIQLPKKEAGAGLAFGGAATDALFGAGSGNVLTKITKYAAGTFFILAVSLSFLQSHHYRSSTSAFTRALEQSGTPLPPAAQAPRAPAAPGIVPPADTNLLAVPPQVEATNAPAVAAKPAAGSATNK
jgi:preprotein translocase subunit SecG